MLKLKIEEFIQAKKKKKIKRNLLSRKWTKRECNSRSEISQIFLKIRIKRCNSRRVDASSC